MAAALQGPRPGRVARPIPSAPSLPRPNARPDGTGGVGRARCPSRLGRAQNPRAPAWLGTSCGAEPEYHHHDLAPAWTAGARRTRLASDLATVRARDAKQPVANGL